MAKNANFPYNGAVEWFMQDGTTGVGEVVGGTYDIDPAVTVDTGAGGIDVTYGGIAKATVNVELLTPLKTILTGMMRAAAATSVVAKTFELGNQDSEWVYTDCQPSGFKATCGFEKPLQVNAGFWAKTPSEGTTGSIVQVATVSGITDTWSTFVILVNAVDYDVQEWSITVNCNPSWWSSQDSKLATTKRMPQGIILGAQEVTLQLQTLKAIPFATAGFLADEPLANLPVTITGSDVVFTFADMKTPKESGPRPRLNDMMVYTYDFPVVRAWGALTIT